VTAGGAKPSMRIGVDLGGTKIEALALEADGREIYRRRIDSPRHDYAATVDAIAALVGELEAETARRGTVGVAIPGAVSPATGRIKNANSTWLNGRALQEDLERTLEREVRLANDANCFAVSEATDGAARDAGLVFGVILGTGAGGAIVHGRRPLTGANAIAGEWGHNPLPWPEADEYPGPACWCGRRGCLETWLSGPALAADHQRRGGEDLSAEAIARRAAAGDAGAEASLQRYEGRLARGLASVINLLDPDVIVLGGGLSQLEQLYERVPALWGEYVFSDTVATRLLAPVHGDASGVRGAAWLWD